MFEQLETTAKDYATIKDEFEGARIAYEVASEKFASVRRLARAVLSSRDWFMWRLSHQNVQYTGLKLGDAITEALMDRAYSAATAHYQEKKAFQPYMTLEALQEALERGGFEFRSATPLREVNGALIHPDKQSVIRVAKGLFKYAGADEILKDMKPAAPDKPTLEPRFDPGDESEPDLWESLTRDVEADPKDAPF